MKKAILMIVTAGLWSGLSMAADCKFSDGTIPDLKNNAQFEVSAEAQTSIPKDLFWANRNFFKAFNAFGCRGAFTSGLIKDNSTGEAFRYYRTNEDECDGGNSYGIIIQEGTTKAVAYIQDSFFTCKVPE